MTAEAALKSFSHGIFDGPHATPSPSDEGPIFLGIKNVTPDGRLNLSEIRHVSSAEFPKWTRRVKPQKNDIVFSYEATLHLYARIPDGFEGCLGRRMALVRPDETKVNPRFLLYFFLSPAWRAKMDAITITGATVNRIPLTGFPDIKVAFPTLDKQTRIAEVLSAYDELIENNRRRIALLEEAARLLYREWFEHLRFPGHEHLPVENRRPHGWKKLTLGDVCEAIGGGTPSTENSSFWTDGEIPWYTPTDITRNACLALLGSEKKITEVGLRGSSTKMLPAGTVLMTSRASVGYFGIINTPSCTNQGFISIVPFDPAARMYLLHNLMHRVEEIRSHAGGATYKEISRGKFKGLSVTLPTSTLLREFEEHASTTHSQVLTLHIMNQKLATARDLLLPRLMNGAIVA
jgi:type I restriction enzyme S subunit